MARLARRAHSEGELAQKMARAGFSDQEIDATMDYLRTRRYLDDSTFARDFARARAERRRWGPARIEHRLRSLKLSDEHIEAALAESFPTGEHDPAERALTRFMSAERRKGPADKRKAKAYRHLISRGFLPETAHEVVSKHDFEDTEELESDGSK